MSFFNSKKDFNQRVKFFQSPGSDLKVDYIYWGWDNLFKAIILLAIVIYTFPLVKTEMNGYVHKVEEARSLYESNYVVELNFPNYPALMQAINSAELVAIDSSELDIDPEMRHLNSIGLRFFKGDDVSWLSAFNWDLYLGMNKLLLYDSARGVFFSSFYKTWIDTAQGNIGVDWTPVETKSGYGLQARFDKSFLTFNLVVRIIIGEILFILALAIIYRVLGSIIFAIKRKSDDRYWLDAVSLDRAAEVIINVNANRLSEPIVVLFGGKYYVSYIDSK